MRSFRLAICTFLFSLAVFAQRSDVSGILIDAGRIVADQSISLVSASGSFETRTDTRGNYRFENVPDGRYLLVYGTKQASVNVKAGAVEIAQLADVVFISANTAQTIDQVSKTVDAIDGQEMRDRADFSLIESLRTIPGFRVQQSGGFGRVATIKTRGLRNQDTALLIDGIRFRDPSAITGDASPFLSDLTLTSVSRIEVLRGSGSSLYGTNAIGGTVDFQTPEARPGTHGQISGAFGGLGLRRFRGNVSHGVESGNFGINAGVSRTVYTRGIDGDDDAHNTNFQSRIDARPFSRTNISGRIFFSDADVRLNSNPDTAGTPPASNAAAIIDAVPNVTFTPDINDPDNRQDSRFFSGQVVVNQVISPTLVIGGYYQGLSTERINNNGLLGIGFQSASTTLLDGTIHTANAHVNWTAAERNTLTAGYEFEKERFGNSGSTPNGADNFSTSARQSSNTFYVQNMLSLASGRLQVAGGFRAQWFSLERPTFSSANYPRRFDNPVSPPASYTGDGAVSYFFAQTGTKLRVHAGNGYRVPSLFERFGSFFFLNAFSGLGNPALKPERSFAIDGGIEQELARGRLRLAATYFYTKINDEVAFLPTDDLGAPAYFNFDKHFSRGAEVSARVRPTSRTEIFASYTFTNSDIRTHSRQTLMPPFNITSRDNRAFGIPDHQFTLSATQRFKRFWVNFDFLATSVYRAPIFDTNAFTFQTYVFRFKGNRKGDLTAGYTFGFRNESKTLRLFGTIENVFDHEYFENGFRTGGASGRIGVSFGF